MIGIAASADDDGRVLVRGPLIALATDTSSAAGNLTGEATVSIPVDLLCRAVLADVLAYEVTIDGTAHVFAPQDVRLVFPAPVGAAETVDER